MLSIVKSQPISCRLAKLYDNPKSMEKAGRVSGVLDRVNVLTDFYFTEFTK